MDPENQLEQKVADYAQLAQENKNVDVAALMLSALQTEDQNKLSPKTKRWGYIVSLAAPPFGLFFAVWFFMSDKEDARSSAWACLALTAVSILALVLMGKLFFSSAGVSVQQVQQIKPQDIYQLTQ